MGEKWKDEGLDCLILDEFLLPDPKKIIDNTEAKSLQVQKELKNGISPQEYKHSEDAKVSVMNDALPRKLRKTW